MKRKRMQTGKKRKGIGCKIRYRSWTKYQKVMGPYIGRLVVQLLWEWIRYELDRLR